MNALQRRIAERNHLVNATVHLAKMKSRDAAARAALENGDTAAAREHRFEALMHQHMAGIDTLVADRVRDGLEPPITREAADAAMDILCDKIVKTCIPRYGEDHNAMLADIMGRFTICVWTSARVCNGCGRLHPPPAGVEKAIALWKAGRREEAYALHEAISESERHIHH
jgi:hypothetical protein